ncbi:MAG: CapA family protein [Solobacterium sp.]|nr:CapA family protein [Solobacterium sp.]
MDMNQNEKRVSLFLSGDAVIHESVYMDAMREDGSFDFDRQLHSIRDLIRNYDLAYYNQETPLGGTDLTLSGYPTFNSPVEFGEYMVKSGFNLISTASNHCLDRGMEGVKRTRDLFHRYPGVLVSGTASVQEEKDTIASMEVNGIRIALVSWCERLFGNIP